MKLNINEINFDFYNPRIVNYPIAKEISVTIHFILSLILTKGLFQINSTSAIKLAKQIKDI